MLTALFLVAPSLAQQVIVDDQDGSPGFTTTGDDWATWGTNGHGFDGGDSEYHYLSHTVGGDDRRGTATWSPDLPQEGTYTIAAWYRLTENRTRDANHVVTDGHGSQTHIVLDQYGDGPSGWVSLGDYWCAAGRGGCTVTLDGTDDDDSDEANATRFSLVEGGGGEDPDPDPDDGVVDCDEFPGLGSHSQAVHAGQVDTVDWTSSANALGVPDGKEATTPNVDAGEYMKVWDWGLCDPSGVETLDSVVLEVKARTQYDSGSYEVRLTLDGQGTASTIFNGTSLSWHSVDLTGELSQWTWEDAEEVVGRITLHDHPAGNRDSDVWVDAWRLTVGYTTTGSDDADTGHDPDPVDTGDPEEDPETHDTAVTDTAEDGLPPDPYYVPGSETGSGCGCSVAPGGMSAGWLVPLAWVRRRRTYRGCPSTARARFSVPNSKKSNPAPTRRMAKIENPSAMAQESTRVRKEAP